MKALFDCNIDAELREWTGNAVANHSDLQQAGSLAAAKETGPRKMGV